jgi:hypothetical protein
MSREWAFLAAESTVVSAAILGSWLMVAYALRRLGAPVAARPATVGLSIWCIVSGCNVALTAKWGASFTALYYIAGLACLASLALYCISLALAKTQGDEDLRR